ncbi:hypothetical protein [Pseudomonas aeruginosa]|uniref:hypothetical protein n=1 Tax=Pseudomonas aeruginosa TaxID=287 RepID=UPI0021AF2363|nr:hypothetical protein [Pseudomonas aeruginosa]MCT5909173.1 hypothetical protein [Pseudomonas aeruginosa]
MNKALDLLRGLVSEVERKTCGHEETHRGGAIWEICDSCGAKWADDEGGKPEFAWPESVEKARAFLATHPAVEQACWDERKLSDLGNELHNLSCSIVHENEKLAEQIGGIARELWNWPQARAALAQPSPKCATCNDSGQIVVSGPHYQGEFQPPEYETEPCDMCAQPSPAQAEQAEAERPEVVAYLFVKPDGTLSMDAVRHKPSQPAVAVMTVAQHERIVKAWIERWKAYIELSAKIAAQRDAALARVAELEKQEPVAWVEVIDRDYGPYNFHGKRLLPKGKHQLYAAPVAQTQHSVPEGWMLVECGIWTQEQVDEMQKTVARFRSSEFVDDRALAMAVADAGQCKAPEISLAELLAAAPGKEGL